MVVEEREGKRFIYGLYYDPERQRTRKCYVGPAGPELVLHSMPSAFLVEPEAWLAALREALARLAENVVAFRPELAPELAKVLSGALAELEALEEQVAGGRPRGT